MTGRDSSVYLEPPYLRFRGLRFVFLCPARTNQVLKCGQCVNLPTNVVVIKGLKPTNHD
jgi:hypothetical protein